MLKALLKKQFLELNTYYFQDRKTGKLRSKGGIIGYIVLFLFIFASIGMAFLGVGDMLASAFLPLGLDWLYFAIMGLISVLLGAFGSVFNTYAGLYHAKDNELLLSMPIPPSVILLVRMSGVYAMSLLYSAIAWVPAVLQYWIKTDPSVSSVIFSVLLTFVLALFVTVLTCVLGFAVAKIAGKLKKKSFFTVLFSLLFMGIYYFVYFRMNTLLTQMAAKADAVAQTVRTRIYLAYQFGQAAAGNGFAMLIFTAITLALFALCMWLMSRSFVRLVTADTGTAKTKYKEKAAKASGTDSALLRKEFKHFVSSPTYMLNCGLGLVLMPIVVIVLLVRRTALFEVLTPLLAELPEIAAILPALAVGILMMLVSTVDITAPSVSLEGKSIWLLQSLPVTPWQVLRAKIRAHIALGILPTAVSAVILGVLIKTNVYTVLLMTALACVYVWFMAVFGLVLNLKKPNLVWTNEVVPVKQGVSVFFSLFGGWAISVVSAGAYYFLRAIPVWTYLCLLIAVLTAAALLLTRWAKRQGAAVFASL